MNVADIVTEHGAVYQDKGQNVASLYQVARRPFVSESSFTTVMTDQTIWQASKTTFDRIVQPFQKAFTPTGTVTFKPVEIRMYHQKADTSEYPDDLEATWLGFMADKNLKRTEWPFIKWYLETQFFPQIAQDLELNEFAKGVYVAPTAGTAGAVGTSMQGYLKIIIDHITAGRITPITMGAVPTDPVELVEYTHDFTKLIDKRYWNGAMELNVNEDYVRTYMEGCLEKYGKNTVMNEQDLKVRFTNISLKGLPGQEGKNRIWCTPKQNAIVLKKKTLNEKLVEVQGFERIVKFLTDWYRGVGFILPEIVFCNDQV